MRRQAGWLMGGALALAVATGWAADDDLSIVKKAVTADAGGGGASDAKATPRSPRKGPEPQWLRIRIVDKGQKKAKVSINLPLGLVKAIGDEAPLDWHCPRGEGPKKEGRCSLRLSEILKALESGQDFVQIEDEDSSVRVYVE
jgi:hypothetical protein